MSFNLRCAWLNSFFTSTWPMISFCAPCAKCSIPLSWKYMLHGHTVFCHPEPAAHNWCPSLRKATMSQRANLEYVISQKGRMFNVSCRIFQMVLIFNFYFPDWLRSLWSIQTTSSFHRDMISLFLHLQRGPAHPRKQWASQTIKTIVE